MPGTFGDTLYGKNIDLSGQTNPGPTITQNGQLIIGGSVPNSNGSFCYVNTLTAGSGIAITNGPGSITITNTGGGGGGGGTTSLAGNTGSATQVGGVINVVGGTNLTTSGAAQTLTISPTGNLLGLAGLAGTGYVVQTGVGTYSLNSITAGSGITITNPSGVGGTTITASPIVPTTFTATAGTATPAANNINFLGNATQGVSSSASGSTVTYTVGNATSSQLGVASFNATNFTVTAGAVTSNALTVTAGTGLSTGGSVNLGGSVTLNLTVPVIVANGGTGNTTLTPNGVLFGNGTSAVGVTAAATNGQVLIGATGAAPAFATVAGTQGVTLTTGANSLSIGLSGVPNSALANSTITVNAGAGITVTGSPVALGGSVTIASNGTIVTQFSADTGVATPSANNINLLGTAAQGISTSGSGSTVTFTIANATTAQKGVASFSSTDFTVTSGAVSLNATGAIKTLTPNSGGAVSPTSSNVNVQGLAANSGGNAFPLFSYNGGSAQVNWENRTYLTPYVVDGSTTNGSKGTFTTIGAAITQATSDGYAGDIFIRAGTYTENITLPAGLSLTAFSYDGINPNVIILGKVTMTAAGTSMISNIRLKTNGDFAVSITGSNSLTLFLENCFFDINNNTHINLNNSNANIFAEYCRGDTATTGIALFSVTAGFLNLNYCFINNSGATITASNVAANSTNIRFCNFGLPLSSSGTGAINLRFTRLQTSDTNTISFIAGGTASNSLENCNIASGSAAAVSVSVGCTCNIALSRIMSSNTNPITGAGSVSYSNNSFVGTGTGINTTTQTPQSVGPTILLSGGCQVMSGSGSPNGSVTAPQGSLWLRTDGTTTNNRAFINTNGGTTWTAITTVG